MSVAKISNGWTVRPAIEGDHSYSPAWPSWVFERGEGEEKLTRIVISKCPVQAIALMATHSDEREGWWP